LIKEKEREKMARTNKKTGDNNTTAKKTSAAYEPVPMTNIPRTSTQQPTDNQKSAGSNQTSTGVGTLERPASTIASHAKPAPTHKQIEDRAKEIWRRKGCPVGQDEQNWLEAETQLKKEMSTK
jgi:hypothetical protein